MSEEKDAVAHGHNQPSFQDNIDEVLQNGVVVVCFQRACSALQDRRLEFTHRFILAELLKSMNGHTGTAWPSRERLAALLGGSEKTVANSLYELKERGYIDWERRPLPGSERQVTQYVVPLAKVDQETLQRQITEALAAFRDRKRSPGQEVLPLENHPAGGATAGRKAPRPRGAPPTGHTPPTGQKTTPPTGHTPPAVENTAPPTGHETTPPAGQQELIERTDRGTKKHMPVSDETSVCVEPSTEGKPKKGAARPRATAEQFARFWEVYPRREGKAAAWKNFHELSPEHGEAAIHGAKRYAEVCQTKKTEERYIKWPQGWISERRFTDYAPTEAKAWWIGRDLALFDDKFWRQLIAAKANGVWDARVICLPPGHPKCPLPKHLIEEMGLLALYGPEQKQKWRGVD